MVIPVRPTDIFDLQGRYSITAMILPAVTMNSNGNGVVADPRTLAVNSG